MRLRWAVPAALLSLQQVPVAVAFGGYDSPFDGYDASTSDEGDLSSFDPFAPGPADSSEGSKPPVDRPAPPRGKKTLNDADSLDFSDDMIDEHVEEAGKLVCLTYILETKHQGPRDPIRQGKQQKIPSYGKLKQFCESGSWSAAADMSLEFEVDAVLDDAAQAYNDKAPQPLGKERIAAEKHLQTDFCERHQGKPAQRPRQSKNPKVATTAEAWLGFLECMCDRSNPFHSGCYRLKVKEELGVLDLIAKGLPAAVDGSSDESASSDVGSDESASDVDGSTSSEESAPGDNGVRQLLQEKKLDGPGEASAGRKLLAARKLTKKVGLCEEPYSYEDGVMSICIVFRPFLECTLSSPNLEEVVLPEEDYVCFDAASCTAGTGKITLQATLSLCFGVERETFTNSINPIPSAELELAACVEGLSELTATVIEYCPPCGDYLLDTYGIRADGCMSLGTAEMDFNAMRLSIQPRDLQYVTSPPLFRLRGSIQYDALMKEQCSHPSQGTLMQTRTPEEIYGLDVRSKRSVPCELGCGLSPFVFAKPYSRIMIGFYIEGLRVWELFDASWGIIWSHETEVYFDSPLKIAATQSLRDLCGLKNPPELLYDPSRPQDPNSHCHRFSGLGTSSWSNVGFLDCAQLVSASRDCGSHFSFQGDLQGTGRCECVPRADNYCNLVAASGWKSFYLAPVALVPSEERLVEVRAGSCMNWNGVNDFCDETSFQTVLATSHKDSWQRYLDQGRCCEIQKAIKWLDTRSPGVAYGPNGLPKGYPLQELNCPRRYNRASWYNTVAGLVWNEVRCDIKAPNGVRECDGPHEFLVEPYYDPSNPDNNRLKVSRLDLENRWLSQWFYDAYGQLTPFYESWIMDMGLRCSRGARCVNLDVSRPEARSEFTASSIYSLQACVNWVKGNGKCGSQFSYNPAALSCICVPVGDDCVVAPNDGTTHTFSSNRLHPEISKYPNSYCLNRATTSGGVYGGSNQLSTYQPSYADCLVHAINSPACGLGFSYDRASKWCDCVAHNVTFCAPSETKYPEGGPLKYPTSTAYSLPVVKTAEGYCWNRVPYKFFGPEGLGACAAWVKGNSACGEHFHFTTVGWCECVPKGQSCAHTPAAGVATYTLPWFV
jgi:hypothetical protein